jgi:tol-pal system protein YbgF
MVLSTSKQNLWIVRNVALAIFVVLALLAVNGCGGSEEATQGEQTGQTNDSTGAQPYDQALTNFVGGAQPDTAQKTQAEPVQTATTVEPQQQMDALKTDNTDLRQKNLKLEDDNQKLTARLNDSEARYAAEKQRADSLDAALKSAPMASSQPMTEMNKTESMANAEIPMAEYEAALGSFRSKKYKDAVAEFQKMLDENVPTQIADNCQYWIGESNYGMRKYSAALKAFNEVLKFKKSEKKGDAQFMIGQCYERMGNKAKAKEAFEKVVKDYPMNAHVKKAKERWARL